MSTSRRTLVTLTAIAIALFAIADPLGDAHHGLGRHNSFLAGLGHVLFTAFLITCVVLLVLVAISVVQSGVRARRARAAR
jgi:hypothetical protein